MKFVKWSLDLSYYQFQAHILAHFLAYTYFPGEKHLSKLVSNFDEWFKENVYI